MKRVTLERGDVATLWLDAPPRNEMDGAFFADLHGVATVDLPGLDARGLVVRGRGRHFSSGADVEGLRDVVAGSEGVPAALAGNGEAFAALESLPYPVVAAIDGCCLGSGLELALACGWRLATPRSLLGLPESTFGLIPGCGGTVRLPALVGVGPALDLILTGRLLDAEEARRAGLVDALADRDGLGAAAERLVLALSRESK